MFPGGIRAIVAQLDRAFGSDPEGQRFESSRSHQKGMAHCVMPFFFACFFTPVGLKAAQVQYAAFLASPPVAAEPEATAANQANGSFSFDPLVFDAAGIYTYTVREKNTGAARVTYDQTVYKVTVKVVNKNGQLTAEVALPDGGLTFTNTYTPEPTPKPDHKDKPKQTPAPASTAQPAAPTQSPRTGDNASLMTWVGLLLVCGTALAGLYVYKKRKQK